jgi:hypothetical protein
MNHPLMITESCIYLMSYQPSPLDNWILYLLMSYEPSPLDNLLLYLLMSYQPSPLDNWHVFINELSTIPSW